MEYVVKERSAFHVADGDLCKGRRPGLTTVTVEVDMRLVWTMCPSTWKRLGLTAQDVLIYFEETPSFAVWQAILLCHFPDSVIDFDLNTVIRTTDALRSMTCISKRAIFRKNMMERQPLPTKTNRLCLDLNTHIPYLPGYYVSGQNFDRWREWVAGDVHYEHCTEVRGTVEFRGCVYVPLALESSSRLCLGRVVPEAEYLTYPGAAMSIAAAAPRVRVGQDGGVFCILPESLFMLRGGE